MTETRTTTNDLYVESWGGGTPVVLVHGSLQRRRRVGSAATARRRGLRLLVLDRREMARAPLSTARTSCVDGDDIAELMGDGAHLVGHSYGGLGSCSPPPAVPKRPYR